MKKIQRILAAISLLLLLCILSGCGQFNEALGPDKREELTEAPTGGGENSGTTEEGVFSVKLMLYNPQSGKNEQYIPTEDITVKWTNGSSYHEAPIDKETGIARVSGLDGDYKVTLSKSPEGYIYNPNVHTATNNNPNLNIDIYTPVACDPEGGSELDPIMINKLGVYRYVIEDKSSTPKFFAFVPPESGTYSVESWVSTTDNNINPILDQYNGNSISGTYFGETIDGGGASASYTSNFKYVEDIDQVFVGNMFMFQIRAEVLDEAQYPITIDFAVQLDGGFKIDWAVSKLMIPTYELKQVSVPYACTLVNPEVPTSVKGQYLLDGSLYGYNEIDGYYHKLDANGEPNGELLFAYISTPSRFLTEALTTIEYQGNKTLTVMNGTENYKFFLEGKYVINNGSVGYFCVNNTVSNPDEAIICPCVKAGGLGYCIEGCTNCHPECRNVTAEQYEAIGRGGYADYATGGMCPVTEELKDCLQKICVSQRYFNDGNGWIEDPDHHGSVDVDAKEDDQWLAFCAYYRGFSGVICDPQCPCAAGSTTPHSCVIGCKQCSNMCSNENSESNLSKYTKSVSSRSTSYVASEVLRVPAPTCLPAEKKRLIRLA